MQDIGLEKPRNVFKSHRGRFYENDGYSALHRSVNTPANRNCQNFMNIAFSLPATIMEAQPLSQCLTWHSFLSMMCELAVVVFKLCVCPLPPSLPPTCTPDPAEGPAAGATTHEAEVGPSQGHLHRHGPGAAPEGRGDADHTRRPVNTQRRIY